jgi:hypothetical protein
LWTAATTATIGTLLSRYVAKISRASIATTDIDSEIAIATCNSSNRVDEILLNSNFSWSTCATTATAGISYSNVIVNSTWKSLSGCASTIGSSNSTTMSCGAAARSACLAVGTIPTTATATDGS